MTTSLLNRLLKTALAFTIFCMLALTNLHAATGPNLLVNGDFSQFRADDHSPSGWTPSLYTQAGTNFGSWYADALANYMNKYFVPLTPLGFDYFLLLGCNAVYSCPIGSFNSASQLVQGLVSGHKYLLSYYSTGYAYDGETGGFLTGPVVASLGSQQAPPAATPLWAGVPWPTYSTRTTSWTQQTFTFDYKGTSSSAWFTLAAAFSGMGPTCQPCYDYTYLAKASLVDVTPTVPLLKVQKALGAAGRIDNADQFKVSIVNASTSVPLNSATTGGTGTAITGGLASISGDTATTYKVVEEMLSGSKSKIAQYDAALSCSNANSSGTQFPTGSVQVGQNFPLLTAADDVTCTLTNTPKAPVLRLTKALGAGGRADPADQFVVQIFQKLALVQSGTSSGTGSTLNEGSTGWVTLTRDLPYTLNETMKVGSGSVVTQYNPVVTCDNALTGSTTVVPSAPGTAFTPVPGDVLDCTITNTRKPVQLRVSQRLLIAAPYVFKPPVDFTYTGNNGWLSQPLSVLKDNQITLGATQTLTAPLVQTTLSAATTAPNWYVASYRCTDENAATSGNVPALVATSTTTSIAIPASKVRAGALITCAMIQSYRQ